MKDKLLLIINQIRLNNNLNVLNVISETDDLRGDIGFNSFDLLPHTVVDGINNIDTFMLTMAMTALGTETSIEKFKKAGAKPFILAAVLYIWLLGGGYLLAKYLV